MKSNFKIDILLEKKSQSLKEISVTTDIYVSSNFPTELKKIFFIPSEF